MLHTKFRENRPAGSGEDFLVVFTIYGRGAYMKRQKMQISTFCLISQWKLQVTIATKIVGQRQ